MGKIGKLGEEGALKHDARQLDEMNRHQRALREQAELRGIWEAAHRAGRSCVFLVWRVLQDDLVRCGVIDASDVFYPDVPRLQPFPEPTYVVPAPYIGVGVRPEVRALEGVMRLLPDALAGEAPTAAEVSVLRDVLDRLARITRKYPQGVPE